MKNFDNAIAIPLLIATILLSGCRQQDQWEKGRPKVYATGGTIIQDGKPLTEAIITFHPAAGDFGGTGVTDNEGHYQLTTFKDRDGVIEGEFRVTVEKNEWIPVGPPPAVSPDGGLPLQQLKKIPRTLPKYANASQSGFTAIVTKKGPNSFDFELESNAK